MKTALPLAQMTTEEKLSAMEEIWVDLGREPEKLPTPEWHGRLLAERKAAVATGEASYADWDEARERLKHRLP